MAKDRKIVITMQELKRIKQEATEMAIHELMRRNGEVLERTAEDSLYIILVTALTALADLGYTEAELYAFADRVADIQNDINDGKRTLEELEKRLLRDFGLQMKKEE